MKRVLGGFLLLWIALILGPSAGQAQTSAVPEWCQDSSHETLPALEARRQALEREVASKTSKAVSPAAPALRKNQEQLLQVLFQIDCLRGADEARAGPRLQRRASSSKAGPAIDAIEVTAYYATNRKRTGNVEPAKFYGSGLEHSFQYGRAVVTIPPNHTPGNLELPTLWKVERNADPSKHFVLKSVQPLNSDAARKEMADKLNGMGAQALLLFVHGYNTGFADAALRTAQLAHDLKFPGMAFFYSWPSANRALAYWQDEEASQLSEGDFERLLGELSQLPVTDIYIVAHSMGNRIVTSALRNRVDRNEPTKHIRELLLAAPDINAELFRATIAPKLAAMQGTQTTIYAASSDLALKASKVVHGFKRVGETVGGVFTYPGFDTIDASSAATMTRAYGHSYLMDSSSVLKDIQAIIEQKLAAKQRGLPEMGTSPNTYWNLQ